MEVRVRVGYVTGPTLSAEAGDWASLPGEGVDWVEVTNGGSVRIASASLYWLYPEGDAWVAGWGSVRYDPNPLMEIICYTDGRQIERHIDYMPDLRLVDVKLGHWWPGEPRPPRG